MLESDDQHIRHMASLHTKLWMLRSLRIADPWMGLAGAWKSYGDMIVARSSK